MSYLAPGRRRGDKTSVTSMVAKKLVCIEASACSENGAGLVF